MTECASCRHEAHAGACGATVDGERCPCGVCALADPAAQAYYSAPLDGLDDLRLRLRGLELLAERDAGRIVDLELRVDRMTTRLLALELRPTKG